MKCPDCRSEKTRLVEPPNRDVLECLACGHIWNKRKQKERERGEYARWVSVIMNDPST